MPPLRRYDTTPAEMRDFALKQVAPETATQYIILCAADDLDARDAEISRLMALVNKCASCGEPILKSDHKCPGCLEKFAVLTAPGPKSPWSEWVEYARQKRALRVDPPMPDEDAGRALFEKERPGVGPWDDLDRGTRQGWINAASLKSGAAEENTNA